MTKCKVATAQIDLALADKDANFKKIDKIAQTAVKQEADFLCLPEYFTTGCIPEKFSSLAEPIPGYSVDKLKNIAQEHDLYIVGSLLEKTTHGIFNTAVLIDPDEAVLIKYRKIHLFMDEQKFITHGQEFPIADTKFGKIGIMICYDAIFPEVARRLALQGVDIIFLPSNWPNPFCSQWKLATSARALDNQLWLVAANRVGRDNKFTYFGGSRVVNPYGEAVIESGDTEDVGIALIDEKKSDEFKNIVHFLNDRQPVVYK